MAKSTCKLEYRLHVPYDVIAVTYCELYFYGDDEYELARKWREIEFSKYDSVEKEAAPIEDGIGIMQSRLKDIVARKENAKKNLPWWRHTNAELKELDDQESQIRHDIDAAEKEWRELDEKRWFTAIELSCKAERFLDENGFELMSHETHGKHCKDTVEIWKRN